MKKKTPVGRHEGAAARQVANPKAQAPIWPSAPAGTEAKPVEEVARDHDGNAIDFAADEKSPAHYGAHLNEIAAYFRDTFPEKWEELKLCPLQHGLESMAHSLAARH